MRGRWQTREAAPVSFPRAGKESRTRYSRVAPCASCNEHTARDDPAPSPSGAACLHDQRREVDLRRTDGCGRLSFQSWSPPVARFMRVSERESEIDTAPREMP